MERFTSALLQIGEENGYIIITVVTTAIQRYLTILQGITMGNLTDFYMAQGVQKYFLEGGCRRFTAERVHAYASAKFEPLPVRGGCGDRGESMD